MLTEKDFLWQINLVHICRKDSLEYNVYKAEERLASQLKRGNNEAKYTSIYLPTVISHLKSIITDNPDLTTEEINTILFKEIDDYAKNCL